MRMNRPGLWVTTCFGLVVAGVLTAGERDRVKATDAPTAESAAKVAALAAEAAAAATDQALAELANLTKPLPPNAQFQRHNVRLGADGVAVETDAGAVSGVNTRVYSNTLGNIIIGPSLGGVRIADDMSTTGANGCILDQLITKVSGDRNGLGTDLLTPFSVTVTLYPSCPGASAVATPIMGIIPDGTPDGLEVPAEVTINLPDGGLHEITINFPSPDFKLPSSLYMAVRFSRSNTGIIAGGAPLQGGSTERFDFPGLACRGTLGDFPSFPHGSFYAELFVRGPCATQFTGYQSLRQSGPPFSAGPGGFFADDVTLDVVDCNMVGYEVSVKGKCANCSGAVEIDLKRALDPTNPESGQRIPGTNRQQFVFRDDVVVAHFDFDPPIQLTTDSLFVGFRTTSDVVGPVISGRVADIGRTADVYFKYVGTPPTGEWVAMQLTPLISAFDITIFCEGSPPIGACCDMLFNDDAGEAVCREVPRRNCGLAIDNPFSTLWDEGSACAAVCVGGNNAGAACTRQVDCDGGDCDGPFPLGPCGLSACCTQDDFCFNITDNECMTVSPDARQYQRGSFCTIAGQDCPKGACIGREGNCGAAKEAFCLIGANAGEVCEPFVPHCAGVCLGGAAPGSSCFSDGQCPNGGDPVTTGVCARRACDGGTRDRMECKTDSNCPGGGTCTLANCLGSPGCQDPTCCTSVCNNIAGGGAFCCDVHWDPQCVVLAIDDPNCNGRAVNAECAPTPGRAGTGVMELFVPDGIIADTGGGGAPSGFCCNNSDPGGAGGGKSVWYKFVAPDPLNAGDSFSSVSFDTCSNSPPAIDSMLQVYSLGNPDLGFCDDPADLSACSVAMQDCAAGTCTNGATCVVGAPFFTPGSCTDFSECVPTPCVFDDVTACENLNPIACNDDAGSACGTRVNNSRVCAGGLVPGMTYYLELAAKDSTTLGQYTLIVGATCTPDTLIANDLCEQSQLVAGADVFEEFDLSGATGGTDPATFDCPGPSCLATLKNDVWYDWVAPATGRVRIDTCGDHPTGGDCNADPGPCDAVTPDTTMVVYEGCDCPADPFSEVKCSDFQPSPCFLGSAVNFDVVKDTCYKIRIGGRLGAEPSGNLEVHMDACPIGPVTFIDPPDGVVDARQPHTPTDKADRQGIASFLVQGPVGTNNVACWSVCESSVDVFINAVSSIDDNGDGTFSVNLFRTITTGAVTTVTFTDGNNVASTGMFTSHPADVDAGGLSEVADIDAIISYVTGAAVPPHGMYSSDVDHSGRMAPSDILRVIDLLNGGDELDAWLDIVAPSCGVCCQ